VANDDLAEQFAVTEESGMLTSAQIFSIANLIAMLCWVALAISLFAARPRVWILRVSGLVVPGLFAIVYLFCIWKGFAATPGGGFGSLSEVRALFANDSALDAGWLHYLAFDLFVGTWIVRQGTVAGMHPLLLLLCLPVTFLLGPIGFLLFLVERAVFARRGAGVIAA
jgi:Domain of unknown function (DUF4281)